MSYHSIVLVKQVPDTANVTGEAMKEDGTVNRAALPAIFNPEDLHALEAALEIKDRFGGTVTVISMGPPKAGDVLRDCLYRGADRAILISDRRAAGSDTLATSYILAQAVKTVGGYDFVFCGRQAIDGDTAQVGPQCAEKLGLPQVTYLEEILEVEDGTAVLKRNVGNGWEVVRVRLPALVTVIDTANNPRPRRAKRMMRYKFKRTALEFPADSPQLAEAKEKGDLLETWSLDDIGADLQRCGFAGSPTKVHKIQSIILTKEGSVSIEPTAEGIRAMVRELIDDRTLG
ncbi:MAG: electron transfer flavoprotein subunit beta/FixA family protein [Thermoguttaceae bacterium]|nr:electron transfer flavoprotein subunit beta/FixA family protein [Thermoguttaceae bacterium]